jgi:DNA-binding transcriptional ArsR family regulator
MGAMTMTREQDIEQLFKILKDAVDADDEKAAALTALAIFELIAKLLASIAGSLALSAKISERQDNLRREDFDP